MNSPQAKLLTIDFYKTLLDSLFDAVYTVDEEGLISYWNESCARITGYSVREMIGQPFAHTAFAHSDASEQKSSSQQGGIQIVLDTGMPGTWKGYIRRKNGQRIPVESHISPFRDENGQLLGAIEIFRDVSAHVSLEDAHRLLLHISRRDQLTSLYNRSAINDLLKAEIERSRRYNQNLSAIMVDIDHFKRINDLYGHDAGDKVLAKIGSIFKHNLRKPDVVGRWGGEEFLILAPGSDGPAAAKLGERIRQFIKEIPIPEVPQTITASFGVSEFGPVQTHDQLLYVADMALYQAKRTGRDRVVIGSSDTKPKTK